MTGYAKEKREDPVAGALGPGREVSGGRFGGSPVSCGIGLSSIFLPGSGGRSEPEEAGAGDVLQTERGDGVPKPHHPKQGQVLPLQRCGRSLTATGPWLAAGGPPGPPFSVNKHSGPPSLLLHTSSNAAPCLCDPHVPDLSRSPWRAKFCYVSPDSNICSLSPRSLQAVSDLGCGWGRGPRRNRCSVALRSLPFAKTPASLSMGAKCCH